MDFDKILSSRYYVIDVRGAEDDYYVIFDRQKQVSVSDHVGLERRFYDFNEAKKMAKYLNEKE